MRKNNVKQLWKNGRFVVNGWLHIPSAWSAEAMAHQGYDALTVDMQHGMMGLETAIVMLQAISTTEVVPMARVPWNEPVSIMRLLDAGAYGIICPMINTREECERFVGACRFHPAGYRSLGPTRAAIYAGADYGDHANEEIMTMAMIETVTAVDNIEEIVSVAGLDAIYVGPGDLSLTMYGKRVESSEAPGFLAELDKVVAACRRHGIAAGIHTNSSEYAQKMIDRGFNFVTMMTDTRLMTTKARETISALRGGEVYDSGSAYT